MFSAKKKKIINGHIFCLIYSHIGIYYSAMARLATTSDVFNAIAEPQRRQILNLLALGERSVNDMAGTLQFRQPQVSKHLKVLKEVGLVTVRGDGQHRLYKLNGENLKPIHDWVKDFEHLWNERFDRLAEYLAELQAEEKAKEHKD